MFLTGTSLGFASCANALADMNKQADIDNTEPTKGNSFILRLLENKEREKYFATLKYCLSISVWHITKKWFLIILLPGCHSGLRSVTANAPAHHQFAQPFTASRQTRHHRSNGN